MSNCTGRIFIVRMNRMFLIWMNKYVIMEDYSLESGYVITNSDDDKTQNF
jgi:hypothetical protein